MVVLRFCWGFKRWSTRDRHESRRSGGGRTTKCDRAGSSNVHTQGGNRSEWDGMEQQQQQYKVAEHSTSLGCGWEGWQQWVL